MWPQKIHGLLGSRYAVYTLTEHQILDQYTFPSDEFQNALDNNRLATRSWSCESSWLRNQVREIDPNIIKLYDILGVE